MLELSVKGFLKEESFAAFLTMSVNQAVFEYLLELLFDSLNRKSLVGESVVADQGAVAQTMLFFQECLRSFNSIHEKSSVTISPLLLKKEWNLKINATDLINTGIFLREN